MPSFASAKSSAEAPATTPAAAMPESTGKPGARAGRAPTGPAVADALIACSSRVRGAWASRSGRDLSGAAAVSHGREKGGVAPEDTPPATGGRNSRGRGGPAVTRQFGIHGGCQFRRSARPHRHGAHHSTSRHTPGWGSSSWPPTSAKIATARLSSSIASSSRPARCRVSARLLRSAASRWRSPWAATSASASRTSARGRLEVAVGGAGAGEVVERGDADAGIGQPLGQLEAALEVARARAEQAEDVVRPGGGLVVALAPRPAAAPRWHSSSAPASPRRQATRPRSACTRAGGAPSASASCRWRSAELPLAAALVHGAQLVLDPAEPPRARRARRRRRRPRAPRRTRRAACARRRSPRAAGPDRDGRARAPSGSGRAPRRRPRARGRGRPAAA